MRGDTKTQMTKSQKSYFSLLPSRICEGINGLPCKLLHVEPERSEYILNVNIVCGVDMNLSTKYGGGVDMEFYFDVERERQSRYYNQKAGVNICGKSISQYKGIDMY